MALQLVVLAAGDGTRMRSDRPKVLHEVAHAPLLHHALRAGLSLAPDGLAVVVGHRGAAVEAAARDVAPQAAVAVQQRREGTARAVAAALPHVAAGGGDTLVLYADTPFLRPETLAAMRAARAEHDVVVLGFEAADPGRYGRLVLDADGRLARIVEWKDASAAERGIALCNSGVICCATALLSDLLPRIGNDNASGEYYLTDIVALARARGLSCGVVRCDEAETLGVNSRADLAAAEAAFQARARAAAMEAGATLTAPETVHFAWDTRLAEDVQVEPMVVFGPGVTVERGARIRSFSHLEGAQVAAGTEIGPFARLRRGAELADGAKIGNFVEVKAARIGPGAKVNHLSYVGDAEVGAGANLGAGTVTCNYDGVSKHRTVIGARAFVGSATMLVAPVRVGAEAFTGSGSVITDDVEDGALAIARARQETKPGLGRKLMARLRAARTGKE